MIGSRLQGRRAGQAEGLQWAPFLKVTLTASAYVKLADTSACSQPHQGAGGWRAWACGASEDEGLLSLSRWTELQAGPTSSAAWGFPTTPLASWVPALSRTSLSSAPDGTTGNRGCSCV